MQREWALRNAGGDARWSAQRASSLLQKESMKKPQHAKEKRAHRAGLAVIEHERSILCRHSCRLSLSLPVEGSKRRRGQTLASRDRFLAYEHAQLIAVSTDSCSPSADSLRWAAFLHKKSCGTPDACRSRGHRSGLATERAINQRAGTQTAQRLRPGWPFRKTSFPPEVTRLGGRL